MSPIHHSYHVLRRPVGARQRPKLHIGPLAVDREHVCYRDTDISAVRQAYDKEEETIGREERGWVDGGWRVER